MSKSKSFSDEVIGWFSKYAFGASPKKKLSIGVYNCTECGKQYEKVVGIRYWWCSEGCRTQHSIKLGRQLRVINDKVNQEVYLYNSINDKGKGFDYCLIYGNFHSCVDEFLNICVGRENIITSVEFDRYIEKIKNHYGVSGVPGGYLVCKLMETKMTFEDLEVDLNLMLKSKYIKGEEDGQSV